MFLSWKVNSNKNKSQQQGRTYMLLYAEILIALIRYFSNYLTLHRSDLAAPLDPHLNNQINLRELLQVSR